MASADPYLSTIARGPLRHAAFFHLSDGSCPAREFLDQIARTRQGRRAKGRFLAAIDYLTRSETHPKLKPWEAGILQLTINDYRLMFAEVEVGSEEGRSTYRTLLAFYGFEKHAKQTPRQHANRTRTLRSLITKGTRYK